MDELRVEVGVKESFKKKLERSRLKWTVHVERIGDKNWQRSDAHNVEGKRRRRRRGMRWEDCVKRDLGSVG